MKKVKEQIGTDRVNLNKVLDFLPYPFLVSEFRDGAQHNIFVNNKFIEEIGYTCEEIPTISDWFMVAYPNKYYRNEIMHDWAGRIAAAKNSGQDSVTKQARIQTKADGLKWYEVKASLYNEVNFVAFVNIDEEIMKEQRLERLNENQDRTLSILSHDLRTPLSNLHSLLQLLKKGQLTKEETNNMLEKLTGQVFKMLEFLDTTLLWSKTNFNELKINRELIDADLIVKKLLGIYQEACLEKNISVQSHMDSNLVLNNDKEIVSILFRNILSNAIKYTPQSGTITISNQLRDGKYMLAVENSGKGIGSEKIELIRSKNYQSERGTMGEKGLGLGLKLCQQLLDIIGGRLEIDSNASSTIFRIVL